MLRGENMPKKYKLNTWNKSVRKYNGKVQNVWIYPYRDGNKTKYRIKKRRFEHKNGKGHREGDESAACNHSRFMREAINEEISPEGIDLPNQKIEIKETRQDKYSVKQKDREAKHFLFYNHDNERYKLVSRQEYEKVIRTLDRTHTPTENQVRKMKGYKTKSQTDINKKIKAMK